MNFYIRKNATMPYLLLKVSKDGRYDYKKFYNQLENSAITFSMIDEKTGVYKIANQAASVRKAEDSDNYLLFYQFTTSDTNKVGTYRGQFKINLYDTDNNNAVLGELIVPIKDDLKIHILDTWTISETNYL